MAVSMAAWRMDMGPAQNQETDQEAMEGPCEISHVKDGA